MIIKSFATQLCVLTVLFVSPAAFALDRLPLPNANVTPVKAEIVEFAQNDVAPANICAHILKAETSYHKEDKVNAIKAYRQCRADHALQQMAVWKWQNSLN